MSDKVDRKVSKSFVPVKHMSEESLIKRVNHTEVEGKRDRSRLCLRFCDEV